jgi:hypothetical protein
MYVSAQHRRRPLAVTCHKHSITRDELTTFKVALIGNPNRILLELFKLEAMHPYLQL